MAALDGGNAVLSGIAVLLRSALSGALIGSLIARTPESTGPSQNMPHVVAAVRGSGDLPRQA